MNADEIRRRLQEKGIPVGEAWGSTKGLSNVESPLVICQKKALRQMEVLLDSQLKQEQANMADLHVALQKLKHGGGLTNGG
jgi:hypothetical protein